MSTKVGKYTVVDSTTLHKGNPKSTDDSTGPSPDFGDPAGGRTAKKPGFGLAYVNSDSDGDGPKGVKW